MRYEITCALPDHLSKDPKATHWVTVDWAHTEDEAKQKRDHWRKKGDTRITDTQKPKQEKKSRGRRRDEDDDYGY